MNLIGRITKVIAGNEATLENVENAVDNLEKAKTPGDKLDAAKAVGALFSNFRP